MNAAMQRRLRTLVPLACAVGTVSVCNAADAPREPAKLYDQTCGYCHGVNVGPVLLGRRLPAAATKVMVRVGLNAMPAFRPTEILDAELDMLARWIESSEAKVTEHGK